MRTLVTQVRRTATWMMVLLAELVARQFWMHSEEESVKKPNAGFTVGCDGMKELRENKDVIRPLLQLQMCPGLFKLISSNGLQEDRG